jgi:hypothetical protein
VSHVTTPGKTEIGTLSALRRNAMPLKYMEE